MEQIKMKRFIECYVPSGVCNMRCEYCCNDQRKAQTKRPIDLSLCFNNIGKALSPERVGGICMVNICAWGETLIPKEMTGILHSILANGHYVMLVTNGTLTKRLKECCDFPEEYKRRLFFKMSFHYLELKRKNMLELFFSNIKMIQNAGISFTVEITPDDGYIPYIQEMKEVCIKNLGTLPHVTVCRDERYKGYPLLSKLPHDEFVQTWSEFDSELFRFKDSIFGERRKEFCYNGEWGFVLNLKTGWYKQCYKGKILGNLYKNVQSPLRLLPIGHNCPEGHCYNGHAFLGFGLIPELITPDYADQRNRVLADGTQWLSKPMEQFMRCRLRETNEEYDEEKKKVADFRSINYVRKLKDVLGMK